MPSTELALLALTLPACQSVPCPTVPSRSIPPSSHAVVAVNHNHARAAAAVASSVPATAPTAPVCTAPAVACSASSLCTPACRPEDPGQSTGMVTALLATASARRGMLIVSSPFSQWAWMPLRSASSGNEKLRLKLP